MQSIGHFSKINDNLQLNKVLKTQFQGKLIVKALCDRMCEKNQGSKYAKKQQFFWLENE